MIHAPLAALLVLVAASGGPAPTPLDALLDAGGHRLHFVIYTGTLPVTVVMEAGGGATLERWAGLDAKLAESTGATVVAYDRAGFGRSELGPTDLTPRREVEQLDALLRALGTPRRRILVGHSYGGLMALLHAEAYPEEVAGLVLVDPMNPGFVDATGDFVYGTVPHIEQPQDDAERAIARMVGGFGELVAEVRRGEASIHAPMVVVTAGKPWWGNEEADRAWRVSHEALATAGPARRLVVAEGSAHDIAATRPDVLVEAVVSLLPPGSGP